VLDLDNGGFIGDRSFGEDVDLVTNYGFATADGIIAAGLTPVAKHFPGHGRGADSHTGLPTLPDLDTLRDSDLVPFIRAIDRGDIPIMIGHLVIPGLTNDKPATLSPKAIDGLLRGELGFDGLVMTDALNMDAISATTNNADAAEQALMAGVDLAMLGQLSDVEPTVAQLIDAVRSGRLEEATVNESFLRVAKHRGIELCSLPAALLPAIGCRSGVGGCSG
jgi:beta-N-acetylhexosaminidase